MHKQWCRPSFWSQIGKNISMDVLVYKIMLTLSATYYYSLGMICSVSPQSRCLFITNISYSILNTIEAFITWILSHRVAFKVWINIVTIFHFEIKRNISSGGPRIRSDKALEGHTLFVNNSVPLQRPVRFAPRSATGSYKQKSPVNIKESNMQLHIEQV